MKNSGDKVFDGIRVGPEEAALFGQFLGAHDFSASSRRAFTQDMKKLARWFTEVNKEPFKVSRVTTRDVADFRDHLRRERRQAVATVNRALVTARRFFTWLAGHVRSNPARKVRELRWHQRPALVSLKLRCHTKPARPYVRVPGARLSPPGSRLFPHTSQGIAKTSHT